ncbi:MAG: rRNA maturation RNase YbeY [Spirochaetaceae bacterium]
MRTDHNDHSSSTHVEISSEGVEPPSWIDTMAGFAQRVLQRLDLSGMELSLLLCDNETMRRLNREYREIDAPTDVLSFGQEGEAIPAEGQPPYLGDLVIALPYVRAQAREVGVSEEEELRRMVVHGILHLAGYEHGEETMETREESPMLTLQEQILEELSEERLF